MKRLSREHHIYVLEPDSTPAIIIDSGEELMVETWDAFEGERDPVALEANLLKGPATGPIYVNGAEPGDALRIEFISITPKEGAAHMVMPMARQLASAARPSTPGVGAVSSPPALTGMSAANFQGPSSISQRTPPTMRALVTPVNRPREGFRASILTLRSAISRIVVGSAISPPRLPDAEPIPKVLDNSLPV